MRTINQLGVTLILLIGLLLAWVYQSSYPPPPCICGSPGCPPITVTRIKLRDGRNLAYKEHGVSRISAKFKIIFIHGIDSCIYDELIVSRTTPQVIEELGVYGVAFDRPGYGESDPDPKRTSKSFAFDVEELADQLGLGSKFYVIGFSMGGQLTWDCLKHIPHRLAGAALIAPAVNYWWSGLPSNLSREAFSKLLPQDRWALRVAHYTPCLTYWWNTRRLFPSFSITSGSLESFSRQDRDIISSFPKENPNQAYVRQQGEFESIHRDLMVGFGKGENDPMNLDNPFPNNEGSVHLWQGDDDIKIVPPVLQRYVANRLPWINYHNVEGAGHMFAYRNGMGEAILKALLLEKDAVPF